MTKEQNEKEQTYLICLDIAQKSLEIARLKEKQKISPRRFREMMIKKLISVRNRRLEQITISDAEEHAHRVEKNLLYFPV